MYAGYNIDRFQAIAKKYSSDLCRSQIIVPLFYIGSQRVSDVESIHITEKTTKVRKDLFLGGGGQGTQLNSSATPLRAILKLISISFRNHFDFNPFKPKLCALYKGHAHKTSFWQMKRSFSQL